MKERVGFPIAEYEEISPMIRGKIKVRFVLQVIILSWVVLLKKKTQQYIKKTINRREKYKKQYKDKEN